MGYKRFLNKTNLLILLNLFFIACISAWAQVEPNFNILQSYYDENPEKIAGIVNNLKEAITIRPKLPYLSETCRLTPLNVEIHHNGKKISPFGLKVNIATGASEAKTIICRSIDRISFDPISLRDFPLEVDIPLLGYKITIPSPLGSAGKSVLINLLQTCPCKENIYDVVLQHLMSEKGTGVVIFNYDRPEIKEPFRITPLRFHVSFKLEQEIRARCVEIKVFAEGSERNWLMRTNSEGEAVIDNLTWDDFPLRIKIPLVRKEEVIRFPGTAESTIGQLFIRAGESRITRHYDEALAIYSEIINIKPNLAEAFNDRGTVKYELGDLVGAAEDYRRSIELKPDFALAHCNRGGVYFFQNQLEAALADFDTALKFNPNSSRCLYYRGVTYQKMDKLDIAHKDLSKAILLNPDYADAYFSRGGIYYQKRKYEEAIKDFSQTVRLNPKHAKGYYYRGIAYLNVRENKSGLDDLAKSCELGFQDACTRIIEIYKPTNS